jgi:preprotein translocase subunit YajC
MIHTLASVLQQTADTAAEKKSSSAASIIGFLPIILIGVAMYFLLIRPQRRRMREQQATISKIEEGDEIITSGGLYGFVTAIDGDVFWVEIDSEKGIEVRLHRSAIARKVNPTDDRAGGQPVPEDEEQADDGAPPGTSNGSAGGDADEAKGKKAT